MKYRNFLGATIVATALVPLLIIAALMMERQSKFIEQSMSQELNRVLHGMSLDIDHKLESLSSHVHSLVKEANWNSVNFDERFSLVLEKFVKKEPLVTSAVVISPDFTKVVVGSADNWRAQERALLKEIYHSISALALTPEQQALLLYQIDTLTPQFEENGEQSTSSSYALVAPVYAEMPDEQGKRENKGYVFVEISGEKLYQLISSDLAQGESIEIRTEQGGWVAGGEGKVGDFSSSQYTRLVKRAVLSAEHIVNSLNYSLHLSANPAFRMQQMDGIYNTLSYSVVCTVILSLLAAAWIIRGIRYHFHLLSKTLAGFGQGNYETRIQKMPFEEFDEVQQILLSMGTTIRQQLYDLKNKNRELEKVDSLREKYLNETQQLNEQLELRVTQQTKAIRESLDKEESLREILHGLLDLSVQLQLHDDLLAMVKECLAKLSGLLGAIPVGVYVNGCKHCEQKFDFHGIEMDLARRLHSELKHYDFKGVDSLPNALLLGETHFSLFGLATRNGRMLGALIIQAAPMGAEQQAVFNLFAQQVSAIIETVQLTSELEQLVRTDELTGFPNRKAFNESLKHASHLYKRYPERHLGVFVIDANGLKKANDDYGHDAGDQLICMLGCILSRTCRQSDQVFRLGGDEFAILVELGDRQSCEKLMARLASEQEGHRLSVLAPCGRQEVEIRLAFSVGYATTECHDVDALFKVADQQMYQQKQQFYQAQSQAQKREANAG